MKNSGNKKGLPEYIEKLKKFLDNKNLIYIVLAIFVLTSSVLMINAQDNKEDISKEKGIAQKSLVVNDKNYKTAQTLSSKGSLQINSSNGLKELRTVQDEVDSILSVKVKAYAIRVNGKDLAILKTKDEADSLLDELTELYMDDEDSEIESIDFKEDVEIVETEADINGFDDYEKALYYISRGTDETKTYKVQKGENYWVIAEKYNISPDDLIKANPDVDPERIQIGQEISLVVPKPFITVVTTETKEYTEYIDYDVEYKETNVLYKEEYKIERNGQKGEKEVVAEIYKENGIEVGRKILNETITKEPVTKIVLKGTKDPPPRIGTGTFSNPTSRGYITSPFGTRWGRMHSGIDIGMPTGTSVKAADGGEVTYAGWKGSYGYLVIINHGANMETYYAHNSKLLVKKGDKVYKGQTIAESGSTGRSTGPHLHFEVRKNGTAVNPTKYVNY